MRNIVLNKQKTSSRYNWIFVWFCWIVHTAPAASILNKTVWIFGWRTKFKWRIYQLQTNEVLQTVLQIQYNTKNVFFQHFLLFFFVKSKQYIFVSVVLPNSICTELFILNCFVQEDVFWQCEVFCVTCRTDIQYCCWSTFNQVWIVKRMVSY